MKSLILIAALVAAGGCGSKKADKEGLDPGTGSSAMGSSMTAPAPLPDAAAMATGSGSGTGSAMAAGTDVDLPTEADFEDDAKAKITDKTVDTELQKVEKDLAQ